MVQELVDLRASIAAGNYEDALAIIDDLEGMSKKAILRNIASFLVRLLIHLIKNQVEGRLTNSWVASITDSIVEIKNLNLKENKKSYYLKVDEWDDFLEEAFARAIAPASVEIDNGKYTPMQLLELVDTNQVINIAQKLLALTYNYSAKDLPTIIYQQLTELPGGEVWFSGR